MITSSWFCGFVSDILVKMFPHQFVWFEAITIFLSALFYFHAQKFLENIRIDGDIIDIIWGYLLI